jgi:broad specificity phosphatase PhoE
MLARIGTRFVADDCVVVVTHGGFAHYLLHAILRSPPDTPVWFDMANGALTHIRFLQKQDREEWPLYPAFEAEILAMNDVAHVRPASRGAVQTCVTSSLVETSEA